MFQKSKDRLSTVATSHDTRTNPCFLRPSCLSQPLGTAGSRKSNHHETSPSIPCRILASSLELLWWGAWPSYFRKKGAIGGWSRNRGVAGHSLVATTAAVTGGSF